MKTWRSGDKYIFNWKDAALMAAGAVVNVAWVAFLMKRGYYEGWYDNEETYVIYQRKQEDI